MFRAVLESVAAFGPPQAPFPEETAAAGSGGDEQRRQREQQQQQQDRARLARLRIIEHAAPAMQDSEVCDGG